MNTSSYALAAHINELRRLALESTALRAKYESAILLIDLYERMLANNGIIVHSDEEPRQ